MLWLRRRFRRRAGDPRKRTIVLLGIFILMFLVVVARLSQLQAWGGDRYAEYGESQRVGVRPLAPSRGAIFDRSERELAISTPQNTIAADPSLVQDPAAAARALAPLLDVERHQLEEKLRVPHNFVYLKRRVDDEIAEKVEALGIAGILLQEEPERLNPAAELARSVLGRVGTDNEGLSGIELRYDEELTGTPGEQIVETDRFGRTIPAGRSKVDRAVPGDDLVLTIDRQLQYDTERILAEQITTTGAKGGIVIVSQPETGEILSLANLETDPKTNEVGSTGNNLAVTSMYEPGSVNKVITVAAALDEGLIESDSTIEVPDSLQVADHLFRDSHQHPTEEYSVTRIVAESSNVGTIKIAQELGKDRLDDYLRRFGFGEETALGLPYEAAGQLLDPDDWSGTSIGSIPIGQGISVTAMQMLYAFNTIAHDGVYIPPSIVAETVDADGQRNPVEPPEGRRVVTPESASAVRSMLAEAVATGTGQAAAIEGYDGAGKTGTARKPSPEGGYRWEDGEYHHVATFAGFLPADDPKVSIIVVIDEPETSPYASDVAAPVFSEIGRNALRMLRIPPNVEPDAPLALDPSKVRAEAAAVTTSTTAPTTLPED